MRRSGEKKSKAIGIVISESYVSYTRPDGELFGFGNVRWQSDQNFASNEFSER
jgi:hypothetical protein